jgi:hypothetical protein
LARCDALEILVEETVYRQKRIAPKRGGFWQTLSPGGAVVVKIADYPEAKGIWKVAGDVICVTYKKFGKE